MLNINNDVTPWFQRPSDSESYFWDGLDFLVKVSICWFTYRFSLQDQWCLLLDITWLLPMSFPYSNQHFSQHWIAVAQAIKHYADNYGEHSSPICNCLLVKFQNYLQDFRTCLNYLSQRTRCTVTSWQPRPQLEVGGQVIWYACLVCLKTYSAFLVSILLLIYLPEQCYTGYIVWEIQAWGFIRNSEWN